MESEFQWIDEIGRLFGTGQLTDALYGAGDDCAVIDAPAGSTSPEATLISVDAQVSDIHFRFHWLDFEQLGRRLFHVGFSDIAAMGGHPRAALVSVEVGPAITSADREAFIHGLAAECLEADVQLIGGNVAGRPEGFSAHIVAIGSCLRERILWRSGARAGDTIFISGTPGLAGSGRRILTDDDSSSHNANDRILIDAFCMPQAHWREGLVLSQSGSVTAAIDISDGLAADLAHVCRASDVGASLDARLIPISVALRRWCDVRNVDPLSSVLHGGEDYILLFTVDETRAGADSLASALTKLGTPLARIGHITDEARQLVVRRNGHSEPLSTEGFDHFSTPLC